MRIGSINICRGTVISLIGGGILGAVAGGVVGYFVSKKVERNIFGNREEFIFMNEEDMDDGINSIYISGGDTDGDFEELPSTTIKKSEARKAEIKTLISQIQGEKYHYDEEELDEEEDEELIQNIFDTVDRSEHEEAEQFAENIGGKPYVISYEEFFETCKHYTKTTLGWYYKEGVLTDENDDPIPEDEWEDWLGDDWRGKFGQGPSHDGDVVFIRNPYNEHDYEVIKFRHEKWDESLYSKEENE